MPLFIKLAPRIGLMDTPDERCIHEAVTPLGGGVVIFIAFNLSLYLIYLVNWPSFTGHLNTIWWSAYILSSAFLLVVGIIDDVYGMPPLIKLAGQALATTIFYWLSDYHLHLLGIDVNFWVGLVLVLIWTLVIINAFNLIDGMDGLCSGLGLISCLGLLGVFILRHLPGDALVCMALVGACAGFLYYNFPPAKVFLGDTGSMFLGFTLATISLYAGGKGSFFVIVAMAVFVAGIPVIDTLLAIWRRSMRKELAKRHGLDAVKIMQADKDHLHHRLINMGLKQQHVAILLYMVNAIVVIIGLCFVIFNEFSTGLFLIIFIILCYVLLRYVMQIELWETSKLLARPFNKSVKTRFNLIVYPLTDLICMSFSVWLAIFISLKGASIFPGLGKFCNQLLPWITPTFLLLFLSKVYIKHWRNSFFRDFLYLGLMIVIGCCISFAIMHFDKSNSDYLLINQLLLFCFFSFIGLMGIRMPHSFLKELSIDHPSSKLTKLNILLYGANDYGILYIRKRYLKHGYQSLQSNLVGFIDDDLSLTNEYIYGKKVLGSFLDVETLIKKFNINKIILTTHIADNKREQLMKITQTYGVELVQWQVVERDLNNNLVS
jgi:UDP-N-acetylmuramyl pentapeptide phosphotransferase/UDP-N-acetylglucosamine-1-phosphate transferase